MASHTDPVCGMQVEEQNAAGKSEHQGNTYYFCSTSCKSMFDQNPASFVAKAGKQQAR